LGSETDTVTLTIPQAAEYHSLFSMILGGIALRRDLSLETLDDLQLAVDSILAEEEEVSGQVSMSVDLYENGLDIRLGPLTREDVRQALILGAVPPGAEDRCIDVCLILRSLVDEYLVADLDDGAFSVTLRRAT
jgi:hypothetical protein